MHRTRVGLLLMTLGACAKPTPAPPAAIANAPAVVAAPCTPAMAALESLEGLGRVPEPIAALLADGYPLRMTVGVAVGDGRRGRSFIADDVEPGLYAAWEVDAEGPDEAWFPVRAGEQLARIAGHPPRRTGDDDAAVITLTSRWQAGEAAHVLAIGARPVEHDHLTVEYLCGRAGATPFALTDAVAMVPALELAGLPGPIADALADRRLHAARLTASPDGARRYWFELAPDAGWRAALEARLVAAGFAASPGEVAYDDAPTPTTDFDSAALGAQVVIHVAPDTGRLVITVWLDAP